MGFHLAAFGKTSANLGAGVYDTLTAKADSYLSTNSSGFFLIPGGPAGTLTRWRARAAYAMGTTMTVAQILNAYMQRIQLPNITPIRAGLTVDNLFPLCDWGDHGPRIPFNDNFGIQADSAAAEVQTAGLWLHDGVNTIKGDSEFTITGNTTITTVLNTWTPLIMSFDKILAPGDYQIVGMDVVGTTGIFARLVSPNAQIRPGVLARASLAVYPTNCFRHGNFGPFMEFSSYALPYMEIFASSAASINFRYYLDVRPLTPLAA